jgi:hypothetical protein
MIGFFLKLFVWSGVWPKALFLSEGPYKVIAWKTKTWVFYSDYNSCKKKRTKFSWEGGQLLKQSHTLPSFNVHKIIFKMCKNPKQLLVPLPGLERLLQQLSCTAKQHCFNGVFLSNECEVKGRSIPRWQF